jgi:hypothetical protein
VGGCNGNADREEWPRLYGGEAWIAKIDTDGKTVWETYLGSAANVCVSFLAGTPDGGFLAGGDTVPQDGDAESPEGGFPTAATVDEIGPWLTRLDRHGRKIWTRSLPLGKGGTGWVRAVGFRPDGSITAVGFGESSGGGPGCSGETAMFWKISADGTVVDLSCPELAIERNPAHGATVMPDGGVALAYSDTDRKRAFAVLLSPDGKPIWTRDLGTGLARCVVPSPGGGIVIGGSGRDDLPWLYGLDRDGSPEWETPVTWAETGVLNALASVPGGGYFAAGTSRSKTYKSDEAAKGTTDMLAVRTGVNGSVLWIAMAGGSSDDWCGAVAALLEGSFMAGGWTSSWDGDLARARTMLSLLQESPDSWIVKFRP